MQTMEATKSLILNSAKIAQKIDRIAWEIYENNCTETEVVMVGIQSNGFTLAQRIATSLQKISAMQVRLYAIHINKKNPLEEAARFDIPIEELKGKVIVVVDDVLNSGKTLLYGIKPFLDIPVKRLQTAVLVDRKHNRYPIKSDYTGLSLATTLKEHISVELDKPGQEAVYLL
jgi:pyrimidine operon attenuation protein/uracil phosphoribosyltransferase